MANSDSNNGRRAVTDERASGCGPCMLYALRAAQYHGVKQPWIERVTGAILRARNLKRGDTLILEMNGHGLPAA